MADHDQQLDSAEKSSDSEEISEEQLRLVSELTKMGGASCTAPSSVALLCQLAMGMIDTV